MLAEAIQSLREQGVDLEIVVVDDGSTDGSARVAEDLGARVVRHETNRGVAAAINSGVAAAASELVMVLAADDLLQPGAAAALLRATRESPDAAVFIPDVDFVDLVTGKRIGTFELREPILDLHRMLAMDGNPQSAGIVYRRAVLVEYPYRQVLTEDGAPLLGNEDWQNWIELARAGIVAVRVPAARGTYRRRLGSVSTDVARKWRAGRALLADRSLRHPDCADCEEAVGRGREALRGYCLGMDAAHLLNGAGLAYAVGIMRRDPHLVLRAMHLYGWTTRDRLRRRWSDRVLRNRLRGAE